MPEEQKEKEYFLKWREEGMKVLMLNGSPRANGNTNRALVEIGEQLRKEGIDWEIFQIGADPVRDCINCRQCSDKGCIFDDDITNRFIEKAREADGFVFGTPVYFAHPSGSLLSLLDRAFFSSGDVFAGKPAGAVAVARRGGTTAALDALQKHITINCMPLVSSTYWNLAHGSAPGEIEKDAEGLQTMRNLGRSMAWLLKCIQAGRDAGIDLPEWEHGSRTDFVR